MHCDPSTASAAEALAHASLAAPAAASKVVGGGVRGGRGMRQVPRPPVLLLPLVRGSAGAMGAGPVAGSLIVTTTGPSFGIPGIPGTLAKPAGCESEPGIP